MERSIYGKSNCRSPPNKQTSLTSQAKETLRSEFVMSVEYLIAGAGSAGCALAYELVSSGRNVLLLEAGGSDQSLTIRMPLALTRAIAKYSWGYQSMPDETRNGRVEPWPRGRVIGGSSSINGMIYVRGAVSDYDRWSDMGNIGWGSADVMDVFKRIERCDPSIEDSDGLRGRGGNVHVRMVQDCHPLTDSFIEAALQLGHKYNPDYNGRTQQGFSYCQFTQFAGRRWSAADAFLRPIVNSRKLRLLTNAHALKLLVSKSGAVHGALYYHKGQLHEVRAERIILCGGAINTPKLLMLSGIGDRGELSRIGVAPTLDRRAVGKNLMEHPMVRIVYKMNVPTYSPKGVLQKFRLLAKYLFKKQGLLASPFEVMAFIKTSRSEPEPDVQLNLSLVGFDPQRDNVLDMPSVMISIKKSYPESRGRLGLTSSDPMAPPSIVPNLLADNRDLGTLIRAIGAVREIMSTQPIAKFVAEEIFPGPSFSSQDALREFVLANSRVTYHPVGTCRMGADDDSVVTPELRVRGLDGLWIADASIMPYHISGNTNAACMMIGTKLGQQLVTEVT